MSEMEEEDSREQSWASRGCEKRFEKEPKVDIG